MSLPVPEVVMSEASYKSHKVVKIAAMNRSDYNAYRGWLLPADEDGTDKGYLVETVGDNTPNHYNHAGYISWLPEAQFESEYTEITGYPDPDPGPERKQTQKTLHNSTVSGARKNVKDIRVVGNGDTFRLICKASSEKEGWMKSTKACEIPGVGCLVQVTTQQRNEDGSYAVAEALTFVPGTTYFPDENGGRRLARNEDM